MGSQQTNIMFKKLKNRKPYSPENVAKNAKIIGKIAQKGMNSQSLERSMRGKAFEFMLQNPKKMTARNLLSVSGGIKDKTIVEEFKKQGILDKNIKELSVPQQVILCRGVSQYLSKENRLLLTKKLNKA